MFVQVVSREKDWKYWCDTEFPEEEDIPSGLEKGLSIFRKLLLIRSWCPDRTLSQARKYIADSLGLEFLENKVSQGKNTYLQVYLLAPTEVNFFLLQILSISASIYG